MLVGKQLGPFTVDKPLGSGAMGAVYRAKYVKTGAYVAIKLMAPALVSNEQSLARFEREANILKQLKHPNIVRLLATGKYQGQPFYAMEYIQGESLDHVLERRQRMTWEEVVALGRPLCSALQHAHEKGIIHRDLKPSNLMVLKDGTVKLTDFGIAKDLDVTQLTSAHCTVGTAAYMSPEQCKGERVLTHKSDLYSLGIVLFELITGRKPFLAETPMEMFLLHVQGKFERPSRLVLEMPPWLDTLICQLLEKKPELRPLDANMVGTVLAQIEDKVKSQKSAGVDAVEKRRVDRAATDLKPEEEDKEAARALRAGLTKKKKRLKKVLPFLQRKWVQAVGICAVLAVIAVALFFGFQPTSPEKLYARADKLMDSSDPDDWKKARDGPITDLFEKHRMKNLDEAHKKQVRDWVDKVDVLREEEHLASSLKNKSDDEKLAVEAIKNEIEDGYAEAKVVWQKLSDDADEKSGDSRALALVADKHLDAMTAAEEKETELRAKLEQAGLKKQELRWGDKQEETVARAIRYQDFGDVIVAHATWKKFASSVEGSQRLWKLLAAKNLQTLRPRLPKDADKEEAVKEWRRDTLIKGRLEEARKLSAEQARLIYLDIVDFYSGEDYLQEAVAEANTKLQPSPEPRP